MMALNARDLSTFVNREVGQFIEPRPIFARLDDDLEIETKAPVESIGQLAGVLDEVKQLGPLGYEHRTELHTLHSDDGLSFGYLIKVHSLGETWVKIKSVGSTVTTTKLALPLRAREGRKFRPSDHGYLAGQTRVASMKLIGSFVKECHNLYFALGGEVFSLSLSLAEGATGFQDYQAEIEYEGCMVERPNMHRALAAFDSLFEGRFEGLRPFLHTQTKGDILYAARRID